MILIKLKIDPTFFYGFIFTSRRQFVCLKIFSFPTTASSYTKIFPSLKSWQQIRKKIWDNFKNTKYTKQETLIICLTRRLWHSRFSVYSSKKSRNIVIIHHYKLRRHLFSSQSRNVINLWVCASAMRRTFRVTR